MAQGQTLKQPATTRAFYVARIPSQTLKQAFYKMRFAYRPKSAYRQIWISDFERYALSADRSTSLHIITINIKLGMSALLRSRNVTPSTERWISAWATVDPFGMSAKSPAQGQNLGKYVRKFRWSTLSSSAATLVGQLP